MALLEAAGLEAGYGEVQVLWGVGLSLERGRLTTLVGANGAGKTTLLRTLVGQVSPWKGTVRFDGVDVTRARPYDKAELGLVLVPEGRQLFTGMTVMENLELGATPRRARGRMRANLERVFALFPRLAERRTQKAGTMSGGEQQMLAVARGLMAEPTALLIDELSLGLAPVVAQQLFRILQKLRDEGLTILLVEQNVPMALAASDDAYVLGEGRMALSGPSREVQRDEGVRRAFLGM